jgi:hypothetical protein
MHILWRHSHSAHSDALVTYAVTWHVYAAVELVCAMYHLVFGRSWFPSRLSYPDEVVVVVWMCGLVTITFRTVPCCRWDVFPPFATVTSTSPRRLPLTSGLQPAAKWQCDVLLPLSISSIFSLRSCSSCIHLPRLSVTSNCVILESRSDAICDESSYSTFFLFRQNVCLLLDSL